MNRIEAIKAAAAQCGREAAAAVGDRETPSAWAWTGLTPEDLRAIVEEVGELEPQQADDDGDDDEGDDEADAERSGPWWAYEADDDGLSDDEKRAAKAAAVAAFYEALGMPQTLHEMAAAYNSAGAGEDHPDVGPKSWRWDDGFIMEGPEPPVTEGVFGWTESAVMVEGTVLERGQWAADYLVEADDAQAEGMEGWWAEVFRAIDRGDAVCLDGIDDAAALLAVTATDAIQEGWTGVYPAALRGAAAAAGLHDGSDNWRWVRGAVHRVVAADATDRTVGYWLSGDPKRVIPWAAWRALRVHA